MPTIKSTIEAAERCIQPRAQLYRHKDTKPGAIPVDSDTFDSLCDAVGLASRVASPDKVFIVTSGYGWGKGSTIKEARRKCRSNTPRGAKTAFYATLVHPETTVHGLGEFEYPVGCPPIALGLV
jgi:hypothetical protein